MADYESSHMWIYLILLIPWNIDGIMSNEAEWRNANLVFRIHKSNNTWNEARDICHLYNNTLLKIPDPAMWSLLLDILDPTQGYPNRHVSIYWFGLHAPNASDTTDYFWDDCTKPGWIEWKTSVNRQGYVPTTNCGFFDVYFQPFTTVLMKLWAMEQCNLKKYFICEDFIAKDQSGCSSYSCEEYILQMDNYTNTDCINICSASLGCNSRFFNASGYEYCHVYPTTTSLNVIVNLCYVPFIEYPVNSCNIIPGTLTTTSIIDSRTLPDETCLHTEIEPTTLQTTKEDTTTAEITTLEKTTTAEITTLEKTTTAEITTLEKTTTAEITTLKDTTIEMITTTTTATTTTTDCDTTVSTTDQTAPTTNQQPTSSTGSHDDQSETSTLEQITQDPVSSTVTSSSTSTSLCPCSCEKTTTTSTTLTLEEQVEQIKKELTVDKKNTSSHKRKFISVTDTRPSATGIGSLGIGILVFVLGSIFLMDLATLKNDFVTMCRHVKSLCTSTKKTSDIPICLRKKSVHSSTNT